MYFIHQGQLYCVAHTRCRGHSGERQATSLTLRITGPVSPPGIACEGYRGPALLYTCHHMADEGVVPDLSHLCSWACSPAAASVNGVSSVLRRRGALLSAASRERLGQFSGPPQVARGDREGHLSLTVACT